MNRTLSIEAGRRWLLTILFVLLTTMLVLIYMHPNERVNSRKDNSYEQNIYDKWYSQTRYMLNQNEWEKAKNLAVKILQNSPDDLFAHRTMAKICVETGKLKQAEDICRKVIFKNPEAALSRSNLAALLYSKSLEEAKKEIAISRQLMPEHPVVKYNYSVIHGEKLPDEELFPEEFPELLIAKAAPNGDRS